MRQPSLRAMLLAGILATGALGCASRGIEVREYVLTSAIAGDVGAAGAGRDLAIGVGPVAVPRYLRRNELVTRVGANELRASDSHRWAEDLDRGLARVVAENLAAKVPAARVHPFPWRGPADLDYRVAIEVERFERMPDGSVVLAARWTLVRDEAATPLVTRRTSLVENAVGTDPAASVGAMSRAAAQLSAEVAAAIQADAGLAAAD